MKKTLLVLFLFSAFALPRPWAQGCGDAPSEEGVTVFGFIQSQFDTRFQNPRTTNTFSFERVRLGVQGAIPYDFSFYAVVELSPFLSGNGSPYLLDAFISYNRFKWARVSVGTFKTPFGFETNLACNDMPTIFRSTAVLQTVAPFRDFGLVFMGGDNSTRLQYQLGIMNGSGLGRADNNQKKDLVARLLFRPLDFVQVGGSFRSSYPSHNNNTDTRTTIGAELRAHFQGFTLMGEYIYDKGDFNRDLGGGCAGELIVLGEERSGGWAAVSYKTRWNVEPVLKFDFFNSGNDQNYKESTLTFGLNYFFNDWTRLQVNYLYKAEQPTELNNDRFVVQLQAKF